MATLSGDVLCRRFAARKADLRSAGRSVGRQTKSATIKSIDQLTTTINPNERVGYRCHPRCFVRRAGQKCSARRRSIRFGSVTSQPRDVRGSCQSQPAVRAAILRRGERRCWKQEPARRDRRQEDRSGPTDGMPPSWVERVGQRRSRRARIRLSTRATSRVPVIRDPGVAVYDSLAHRQRAARGEPGFQCRMRPCEKPRQLRRVAARSMPSSMGEEAHQMARQARSRLRRLRRSARHRCAAGDGASLASRVDHHHINACRYRRSNAGQVAYGGKELALN